MSSEAKKRVRQSLNEYGLWGGFKFSWSSHQHLSDACSEEQLGFIATSARGRDKLYSGGEKTVLATSGLVQGAGLGLLHLHGFITAAFSL